VTSWWIEHRESNGIRAFDTLLGEELLGDQLVSAFRALPDSSVWRCSPCACRAASQLPITRDLARHVAGPMNAWTSQVSSIPASVD
jgi:hypothetical protein